MLGSGGLTLVTTEDLERLLRAVHRKELPCPIDRIGLASTGLLRTGDDIGILLGLEERAVRALLVCVLAERRRQKFRSP